MSEKEEFSREEGKEENEQGSSEIGVSLSSGSVAITDNGHLESVDKSEEGTSTARIIAEKVEPAENSVNQAIRKKDEAINDAAPPVGGNDGEGNLAPAVIEGDSVNAENSRTVIMVAEEKFAESSTSDVNIVNRPERMESSRTAVNRASEKFNHTPSEAGTVTNEASETYWNNASSASRSPLPRQSPDPPRFPPGHSPSQLPTTGTGYSLPFPPFLANPFMAPYLPQYGAPQTTVQHNPMEEHVQPPQMGPDSTRMPYNPYSGGYFLTPSQYQEMMQQYFQSVLAAGGLGQQNPMAPHGVSPVSEPGDVVYDDTNEAADELKRMKLEGGGRHSMQAYLGQGQQSPWYPGYPMSAGAVQGGAAQESTSQDMLDRPAERIGGKSASMENVAQWSSLDDGSESGQNPPEFSPNSVQSHTYSYPSPATTISENKVDSVPDSIQSSPEKVGEANFSQPRVETAASQSDSEVELRDTNSGLEKAEADPAGGEKENITSELIKKQMTEIEKGIIRKRANLNIKKSGVPWTGEAQPRLEKRAFFEPVRDPRSLNELRPAEHGPHHPAAQPIRPNHLFQPHFPQAALTSQMPQNQHAVGQPQERHPTPQIIGPGAYPAHPMMVPGGTYPNSAGVPGAPFYGHPQQPTGYPGGGFQPYAPQQQAPRGPPGDRSQMVAARLAEDTRGTPRMPQHQGINQERPLPVEQPSVNRIPMAPVDHQFAQRQLPQNGHGNLVRPVQDGNEGMRKGRVPETDPDQNGCKTPTEGVREDGLEGAENTDEPVWVMRESYLRRVKREEERQQQRERREEQLALAMADRTAVDSDTDNETDRLLEKKRALQQQQDEQDMENSNQSTQQRSKKKKEVMIHEPAVLIEGVLFRARYLGSTQLTCEGRPSKTTRMMQAQEAVSRIKSPEDEEQPSTEVDLFISTEKIMVLNTDLQRISDTDVRQDIMMDHPLRTISYIADIGDVVVLMARRVSQSSSSPDSPDQPSIRRTPKIICHVFESDEAQFIAQSIGQAFQVAYVEFLRANGIDDPRALQSFDYEEVLNSQEIMGEELEMFANKESQKDVVIPKQKGEHMGVVVVESGWGSMLPTVVVANLMPGGPASRCNQLNIGDQIIAINGISLVGLPLSSAQTNIKNTKNQTAVKLTVVHTPPVVEVRIRRPDSKYQLGFSVQNGVICSLLRGGIAERGGVRVGHRIIEINNQSVVAVAHEKIVNMLANAVGEIQMKTMPTSMFRLLTGQETPNYI